MRGVQRDTDENPLLRAGTDMIMGEPRVVVHHSPPPPGCCTSLSCCCCRRTAAALKPNILKLFHPAERRLVSRNCISHPTQLWPLVHVTHSSNCKPYRHVRTLYFCRLGLLYVFFIRALLKEAALLLCTSSHLGWCIPVHNPLGKIGNWFPLPGRGLGHFLKIFLCILHLLFRSVETKSIECVCERHVSKAPVWTQTRTL